MPYSTMTNTTHDRYLETQVLHADPVQLVNMLYRGAIEAVGAGPAPSRRGGNCRAFGENHEGLEHSERAVAYARL